MPRRDRDRQQEVSMKTGAAVALEKAKPLKIEIDPMITHTMPLSDINKGFDLMHEGKSIRSVVIY
jgi:Zn-dependent alcohol dehydrogenase